MSPFEGNIKALAGRDPLLAAEIAGKGVKIHGLSIATSRSGRPYLRMVADGINAALEDENDPAAEAKRASATVSGDRRLVVVKGFGSGYLPKALHSRKNIERLIFVEPRIVFFAMMLGILDLRRVIGDPRCEFFVGDGAMDAIERMKSLYNYGTEPNRLLIILPSFQMLRHRIMDQSKEFERKFDREFAVLTGASERNRATLERFLPVWRGHIRANMRSILESGTVASLRGAADGAPGILVAAGPSLDRNVAGLPEARKRAVVVAVDTAWRTLATAGIAPDFVISVDATEANLRDFEGTDRVGDETALVMVPVIQPAIARLFRRRYVASYGHPLQKWLEEILDRRFGSLLVSGSVATIGFDLLRYMGASPIVIVGMDLAFGETTHTRGAMHGDAGRFDTIESRQFGKSSDANLRRPGWGGGEVMTTREMIRWIEWFELEIERSGWKTINATEGGASIKGAREMSLDKAIEKFRPRRVRIPEPSPVDARSRERFNSEILELARSLEDDTARDSILRWETAFAAPAEMRGYRRELIDWAKAFSEEVTHDTRS